MSDVGVAEGTRRIEQFSEFAILLMELASEATDNFDAELPVDVDVTVEVSVSDGESDA